MRMKTKRLIIRPFHRDDFHVFFNRLCTNPNWTDIFDRWRMNELDARRFFQHHLEKKEDSDVFGVGFGVFTYEDTLIGYGGFSPLEQKDSAEIFFGLVKDFRGTGLGLELLQALTAYAMGPAGLNMIIARTNVDNDSTRQILLRVGYQQISADLIGEKLRYDDEVTYQYGESFSVPKSSK